MEELLKTLTPEQKKLIPHLLRDKKKEEIISIFGDNYKYKESNYGKYIEFFNKYKDVDFYIIIKLYYIYIKNYSGAYSNYEGTIIQNILYNDELLDYYTKEELKKFEFKNNKLMELIKCPEWKIYKEFMYDNKTIFCLSNLDNVHILNSKAMSF